METQDSWKITGVKTNTFFWPDIRQSKAIANVKMININIPHDRVPIVQGEEVFGVIFGGSLHINLGSSSQQISI
jgi:hypothetical protein